MNTTGTRKPRKTENGWPRKVTVGRVNVSVYKRRTPSGCDGFLVANYADGRRRFDSFATEGDALEAAAKLARQLSERDVIGASMTREQAIEFASASQSLKPFGLSLPDAANTLAECLKQVGDVPTLHAALRFYAARHKRATAKRVADAVAELLEIKKARGASERHLSDLRSRLERFARDFACDVGNVTTAQVQAWLDGLKLSPQSIRNFRTVLHVFFQACVARGYCPDNPIANVERVKVTGQDVQVFTPAEIAKLLKAASPTVLPALAIGAFAGLRSAEIERLEWPDIHLSERFIVVGASKAKTASRRIVPVSDNLAAWLAQAVKQQGPIWRGTIGAMHNAQRRTAKRCGMRWKKNALRHSFASYSFALTHDAGRIAGYLGNSAQVVHRHYRELVSPKAAQAWFSVFPEGYTPTATAALPDAKPAALSI